MPVIKWPIFTKMPIVIPSNNLIKQFNDFTDPLLQKIIFLVKKNQQLRAARDLLLPKLISGQLDVSELDIATEEMVTA